MWRKRKKTLAGFRSSEGQLGRIQVDITWEFELQALIANRIFVVFFSEILVLCRDSHDSLPLNKEQTLH